MFFEVVSASLVSILSVLPNPPSCQDARMLLFVGTYTTFLHLKLSSLNADVCATGRELVVRSYQARTDRRAVSTIRCPTHPCQLSLEQQQQL